MRNNINPFGDSAKKFAFFPSANHRKCTHRIIRGLESNCGLILLAGEVGVGKTSVSRFVQSILSKSFSFVELDNPYQTALEQVYSCCMAFGLDSTGLTSIHDCVHLLEQHFHDLRKGGQCPVLVFEESHLLTKKHLNLIHILSNLRFGNEPLVQILIVGQLEVLDLLAIDGAEALNQRIGVRCELAPLAIEETGKYIQFKVKKQKLLSSVSFSREAVQKIWRQSRGVPRLINHVCAHALDMLVFDKGEMVTKHMVDEVCKGPLYSGLFQGQNGRGQKPIRGMLVLAALLLAVGLGISAVLLFWPDGEILPPDDPRGIERLEAMSEKAPAPSLEKEQESMALAEAGDASSGTEDAEVLGDPSLGEDRALTEGQSYVVSIPIVIPGAEAMDEAAGPAEGSAAWNPEPEAGEASAGILDGERHPVVGQLVIGAIAWDEDPALSVAVIDSTLVHEGDSLGAARVVAISQDSIIIAYDGDFYERSIAK